MAEKKEKLFDMFPPVSYDEWRAKVEADLKGADFDKKLVWRTSEGFNVQPVYRREDLKDLKTLGSLPGQYPYVRGTRDNNDWLTRQNILTTDPEAANAEARDILTKGVTSLGFTVKDNYTEAVIATYLKDIDLEKVEVNFTCCHRHAVELAQALVAYLKKEGKTEVFHGSIDFHPLRPALRKGRKVVIADVIAEAKALLEAVKDVKALRCLSVDSAMLANAGSYIYQELGYALAWGAAWMTTLTDAGMDATEVACRIKFNMAIGPNFFMEIAKFRAARMLWAEIVEQYKPSCPCAAKMVVNASTSTYNQTIYDAYVNLLRSQTETFSAAVAGVDSITTTPFDLPYKTPDQFSERIARNQQFLLKEEAHMDKVVDPAGGSYYVETLTKSIAEVAWKLFLEVTDGEGFFALVNDGKVQEAIVEANKKRHTDVARRKESLLGTNQYPNVNEKAKDKIEKPIEGACACACQCGDQEKPEITALPQERAAVEFEQVRLATENATRRPKVFMLTIGNLAMRLARAQFSGNFFGCAGYEIIDNLGFDTVEEGIKAAMDKKADVVVLCSSDDEYATLAPEAFKLLDGRAQFVVAGAPACMDDLKAQGINDFVHVRVNVLDTLKDFNARLLNK